VLTAVLAARSTARAGTTVASSSSVRPARLTGSVNTSRFGAVGTWWQRQKGDLVKDVIIGFLVGVVLFLGACWWDARLEARQDALSSAIASRQDDLARDLANQAEVLENTRFVRSIATSTEATPKPFTGMNLGGAELAGLPLQCTDLKRHRGCADFSEADLSEANLARTDLGGAIIYHADVHQATLDGANFDGAILDRANLDGVVTRRNSSASFRGARLDGATLIHARLYDHDFSGASFIHGKADEAYLFLADFPRAKLVKASFKHADLRHVNFRGARVLDVDLTSADLRGADLRRANLTSADLRGADLRRADMRKAVLTDVCFDATTIWGSNRPPTSSSC
jgi:uncharacterized protein YjbI with pentapeptide repeats